MRRTVCTPVNTPIHNIANCTFINAFLRPFIPVLGVKTVPFLRRLSKKLITFKCFIIIVNE